MPQTTQNTEDKQIRVGQLRLKRTVYANPRIVRLYMNEQTYFDLNIVAHCESLTPDELLRDILADYLTRYKAGKK